MSRICINFPNLHHGSSRNALKRKTNIKHNLGIQNCDRFCLKKTNHIVVQSIYLIFKLFEVKCSFIFVNNSKIIKQQYLLN